jgi:F-type H+-transporting ATPase subunit c
MSKILHVDPFRLTSQIQPRGAFDAIFYITNPPDDAKYFLTSFSLAVTYTAKIKERRYMMKRTFSTGVFAVFAVLSASSLASAAEAAALGTIGTGLGMGNGLSSAANAVGRNPEAQGKILITMMVGLAMIESLAIYALVIALVVLYANPLLKVIGVS